MSTKSKKKNELVPQGEFLRCPHCGTVNPMQSIYCSECGRKMRRMDYLMMRTKQELKDPKSRVIAVMGIIIFVLIILLIIT